MVSKAGCLFDLYCVWRSSDGVRDKLHEALEQDVRYFATDSYYRPEPDCIRPDTNFACIKTRLTKTHVTSSRRCAGPLEHML